MTARSRSLTRSAPDLLVPQPVDWSLLFVRALLAPATGGRLFERVEAAAQKCDHRVDRRCNEVFLVSRIHEEWQHRGDASAAVREGLANTGRVITAAAGVMVVVFASFAAGDDRVLKLFGVAMATAVFLDAIVIRSILMPAVLELFGRRTWAFPGSFDRRLPRLAIEPAVVPEPALERAA